MSDSHADFFNCWWANIDWEVRGCCFDVGWFSGADRFKSSLKCSTHLFRCYSMLVITSPSLLFTRHSGLQ
ncbi:unnamed protein product [Schistosoma margrebowiei]|uniref:Uncharacterized protein n=1 Tax=Schistosoma margrebowiei TaxID=48269 RepID=A0A3P8CDK9_9TREM|nr:unnamed protein product [Schistosoma margrebowiei]